MKIKVRTGLESPWDECYLQTSRALHFNERYFTWCVYVYPTPYWDKRDGYIQWATVIPDLKNYILECQCCHNGLNPDFTVKEISNGEVRNITKMQKISSFLKSLFFGKC